MSEAKSKQKSEETPRETHCTYAVPNVSEKVRLVLLVELYVNQVTDKSEHISL